MREVFSPKPADLATADHLRGAFFPLRRRFCSASEDDLNLRVADNLARISSISDWDRANSAAIEGSLGMCISRTAKPERSHIWYLNSRSSSVIGSKNTSNKFKYVSRTARVRTATDGKSKKSVPVANAFGTGAFVPLLSQ